MPLHSIISNDPSIELAVWNITEDNNYFLSKLAITKDEQSIIDHLKNRKLKEWLGSRYLLHIMSGRTRRGTYTKDIHGKPYLEGSTHKISISHSNGLVAVIASKKVVGIDIQTPVLKIQRIRHKFVSDREELFIKPTRELITLHILWGAKESLYKAYGKRGLNFIAHIKIYDLNTQKQEGTFRGKVEKEDYSKWFDLNYKITENYILVYAKDVE